ncbi:hypothetical protein [Paraferrimonas haliotis]|uniref:Uncharacterized protein n=1 Tax=Paraferrimonas haliotis TaxID=2013866 RepID=A0AA37TM82_9GAMM|nr:hypothetical protein [Paraferrimonas haliotis]GLS84059.1 hypothetical protein GCM10007894_20360 [Paraferrimonas haliotis]
MRKLDLDFIFNGTVDEPHETSLSDDAEFCEFLEETLCKQREIAVDVVMTRLKRSNANVIKLAENVHINASPALIRQYLQSQFEGLLIGPKGKLRAEQAWRALGNYQNEQLLNQKCDNLAVHIKTAFNNIINCQVACH